MSPVDVQLRGCSNALTLMERIALLRSGTHVEITEPNADFQPASERANRWQLQYPFSDPDVFAQRLATAKITEQEFLAVTGDDEARLGTSHAPWAQVIDHAYALQETSSIRFNRLASNSDTAQVHFLRCVEPIVDHFVSRLRTGAKEMMQEFDTVPFDADSVHQLFVPSLINTYQRMLTPTLILELNLARLRNDLTGESSSERFDYFIGRLRERVLSKQILTEYPVLARELVGRADQWLASSLEFLRRLSRDWPIIQTKFSPPSDAGILYELQTQLGDRHRDGRSVQIARFGSGFSIVYKPRSLQVDGHFQELLEWFNRKTGDLAFQGLTILDRGTHGWSEFVPGEDCLSVDGVRRFYERQGGYLALFYILNGSDIHCENVIASGEHPFVVDLEVLFHAPIAEPRPGLNDVAVEGLARSVLRCGLLPMPARFGESAEPLDRSGLAAPLSQLSPFALLHAVESGTDEMQLVRKRSPIRASAHWPKVAGQPVEAVDVDAVERGFRRVCEVILSNRGELLDVDGPIARFRGDKVRIVLRYTRS